MTLGQWYYALKGFALGKYHTKFQLSSPKGMKVISCKRNADVKLHLNLQVRKLEPGYERDIRTYARTDITSRRNAICPIPAFGRWGHINKTHSVDNAEAQAVPTCNEISIYIRKYEIRVILSDMT